MSEPVKEIKGFPRDFPGLDRAHRQRDKTDVQKRRFDFAEFVCRKHDVFLHGDYAECGNYNFAAYDNACDNLVVPSGQRAVADKDKQHNDDDDLIGNRVQKFPEVGHEISFSCDVAVDKVGAATKHKHYARRDFMIRKIHEI